MKTAGKLLLWAGALASILAAILASNRYEIAGGDSRGDRLTLRIDTLTGKTQMLIPPSQAGFGWIDIPEEFRAAQVAD